MQEDAKEVPEHLNAVGLELSLVLKELVLLRLKRLTFADVGGRNHMNHTKMRPDEQHQTRKGCSFEG